MRVPAPSAMTDDRLLAALRTAPRQRLQGNPYHPGSALPSGSGNAIKRINGWREGPPLTVAGESSDPLAGPSPSGKVSSNEKKVQPFAWLGSAPQTITLAGKLR